MRYRIDYRWILTTTVVVGAAGVGTAAIMRQGGRFGAAPAPSSAELALLNPPSAQAEPALLSHESRISDRAFRRLNPKPFRPSPREIADDSAKPRGSAKCRRRPGALGRGTSPAATLRAASKRTRRRRWRSRRGSVRRWQRAWRLGNQGTWYRMRTPADHSVTSSSHSSGDASHGSGRTPSIGLGFRGRRSQHGSGESVRLEFRGNHSPGREPDGASGRPCYAGRVRTVTQSDLCAPTRLANAGTRFADVDWHRDCRHARGAPPSSSLARGGVTLLSLAVGATIAWLYLGTGTALAQRMADERVRAWTAWRWLPSRACSPGAAAGSSRANAIHTRRRRIGFSDSPLRRSALSDGALGADVFLTRISLVIVLTVARRASSQARAPRA